jgi:glutamate/aspartate transport system ATP-binding protein
MPMIEIKAISKWYGSFQVLSDCSTHVDKGDVVATLSAGHERAVAY